MSQPKLLAEDSAELKLPEIIVSGKTESALRLKRYEINRIEVLRPDDLRRKQAQTFSQLLANERGIDAQTACAFCGAKRLTINGLRGEHTTILIDGLPLHSTVSSFYGVDAIPLPVIDSIDVYRGAGAALQAPESIGGALNILTREPLSQSFETLLAVADDRQSDLNALASYRLGEKTGVLMAVHYGEIQPIDVDANGVSELPFQQTENLTLKMSHRFSADNDLSLRLSHAKLDTIGGSMQKNRLNQPVPFLASEFDFKDGDVRQPFIGDQNLITDNIRLDRTELALISQLKPSAASSLRLGAGAAYQQLRAIYNHGYDYDNLDRMWVGLAEYSYALTDDHLLTVGFDTKNQRMDTESEVLFNIKGLPSDRLRYQSMGGYLQDSWFMSDQTELSAVLRFDQIKTDWLDLDRSIDETVFAPRFFIKHAHNEELTSRFSYGLGYRSPLTLFESQHGTSHQGFLLEVDRLEKAHSLTYSFAGQYLNQFFEVSGHLTKIENMAYGLDQADIDDPTLFRNAENDYTIAVLDMSYGYRISHHWTLEGLAEWFQYPRGYKEKLPIAAIERRLSLQSNLSFGKWRAEQRLTFVGSRDLTAYLYDRHWNVAFMNDDIEDENFGEITVRDQKRQKAPGFFTLDLNFERELDEDVSLNFAILNVFNYTQTGAGDSPLTWHLHGNHFHLDNFHIWGPLRGRQIFLRLNMKI